MDKYKFTNVQDENMSIITHYRHTKGTSFAKTFAVEACTLLPKEEKAITNKVCEPEFQYGLFADNEIPFPSPKKPKFTFIDLLQESEDFALHAKQ